MTQQLFDFITQLGIQPTSLDQKGAPVGGRKFKRLIENHVRYTNSPRGTWILDNFGQMLSKFVKVFPLEYKRVLGVPALKKQDLPKGMPLNGAPAPRRVSVLGD